MKPHKRLGWLAVKKVGGVGQISGLKRNETGGLW